MNTKLPLILALIFAAVAVYGIIEYLKANKVTKQTTRIIVAQYPIEKGTRITSDMVRTREIDRTGYMAGTMIRSGEEAQYYGWRATMDFAANQPLLIPGLTTEVRVKEPLAPMIEMGMRALSLPVSGLTSVSNMIEPGDHIDIIVTMMVPKIEQKDVNLSNVQGVGNVSVPTNVQSSEAVTVYLLQDVTVVATGKSIIGQEVRRAFEDEFELGYDAITLQVSPDEAPALAFAMTAGSADGGGQGPAFVCLLRNPADPDIVEEPKITNYNTILDLVNLSDLIGKRKQRRQVEIYSGGTINR